MSESDDSLTQLKDCSSPNKQAEILNEICTMLCIGMEDYIRSFNVHGYLPAFVSIMAQPSQSNDEVLVLTCRALALVLDVVPHSCSLVVQHGSVPKLIKLLKTTPTAAVNDPLAVVATNPLIEEILKALDKISLQEPGVLLAEEDFLSTLLVHYPSFSEPLRNRSLDIIANLARKCTCENTKKNPRLVSFDNIVAHVPTLGQMCLHVTSDLELDKICKIFAHLIDKCQQFNSYSSFLQLIGANATNKSETSLWEPLLMRLHRANTKHRTKDIILKILISFAKFSNEHSNSGELCGEMTKHGLVQVLKQFLSPQEEMRKNIGAATSNTEQNATASTNQLLLDSCYLLSLLCPTMYSSYDLVKFQMEAQHDWSWEDDFHNFHPYDKSTSQQMEKAYSASQKEATVSIRGNSYRIDFVEMKQYNTSTNLMRNVSRNPIARAYKKVSQPIKTPSTPDVESSGTGEKKKRPSILSRVFKKQKTSSNPTSPSSPTSPSASSPPSSPKFATSPIVLSDEFFNTLTEPLIQLASTSANEAIREVSVVALAQILTHTKPATVLRNDETKNHLSKFVHRVLRRNSQNAIIVSHVIHLVDELINIQESSSAIGTNIVHLLIRENLLTEVETCGTVSKSSTVKHDAKAFAEKHRSLLSQEVASSAQLQLLTKLTEVLTKGDAVDFGALEAIFATKESQTISTDQFIRSQFPATLWRYLKSLRNNRGKLHLAIHSLVSLFDKNRDILLNFVEILNSSLELLETFPTVATVEGSDDFADDMEEDEDNVDEDDDGDVRMSESPSPIPTSDEIRIAGFHDAKDLKHLAASKIALVFKLKDDYDPILSDLSETNTYTISPLCSMRAVEQFIVDKCVANAQKRKVVRLDLFVDGQFVENPYSMTLYECIRKYAKSNNYSYVDVFNGSSSYTIQYTTKKNNNTRYPANRLHTTATCNMDYLVSYYLNDSDMASLQQSQDTITILCLLRLFNALNKDWHLFMSQQGTQYEPLIPANHFINDQLSSKISQEMVSPVALALACGGQLPAWNMTLLSHCSFLFPFSTRCLFFSFLVSGAQRTVIRQYAPQQYMHRNHSADEEENKDSTTLLRHQAQRVKIMDRSKMLEEGRKALAECGTNKTVLEFEYEGEAGVGLGPTLQFYTTCSRELQLKRLDLWYDNQSNSYQIDDEALSKQAQLYVSAPFGVFPNINESSMAANAKAVKLSWFTLLGRLIAKSLEDNRLCDINLSKPWFDLLLGKPALDIADYASIDPFTNTSVKQLLAILKRLKEAQNDQEKLKQVQDDIDNMVLTMNYRNYDLVPKGSDVDVTSKNYEQYLALLQKLLFQEAYTDQLNAFCNGFHEIINLQLLNMFTADELKKLICGNEQLWSSEEDVWDNITTSHGYTMESPQVKWLVNVIAGLSVEDQRLFLEFSTGTTRLPIDGKLTPKLTISRKTVEDSRGKDDDSLVTCNTCFHLIKLPAYSSQEILQKKLILSIRHGRGSFELS